MLRRKRRTLARTPNEQVVAVPPGEQVLKRWQQASLARTSAPPAEAEPTETNDSSAHQRQLELEGPGVRAEAWRGPVKAAAAKHSAVKSKAAKPLAVLQSIAESIESPPEHDVRGAGRESRLCAWLSKDPTFRRKIERRKKAPKEQRRDDSDNRTKARRIAPPPGGSSSSSVPRPYNRSQPPPPPPPHGWWQQGKSLQQQPQAGETPYCPNFPHESDGLSQCSLFVGCCLSPGVNTILWLK